MMFPPKIARLPLGFSQTAILYLRFLGIVLGMLFVGNSFRAWLPTQVLWNRRIQPTSFSLSKIWIAEWSFSPIFLPLSNRCI